MTKTLRSITRSGFANRLGLFAADLSPRQGSQVGDCITRFYSLNGEHMATFTRCKCPITGKFEDQFFVAISTDQCEEALPTIYR